MSDFRLRSHASQARQHKKRHGPNTPKMALDCRVNRVFSLVQQQVGENMFYLRICCSSAVFVYLVKGNHECATFEEVHLGSALIALTQMEWGLFRYTHIYIYTHRCSCKWGPIIIPSLVFPLFHSLFSSALHSSCPSLLWKRSLLPSYRKNSVLTKSAFKARTKRLETVSFPKAFFPFWTHTRTDWGALFFSALFF